MFCLTERKHIAPLFSFHCCVFGLFVFILWHVSTVACVPGLSTIDCTLCCIYLVIDQITRYKCCSEVYIYNFLDNFSDQIRAFSSFVILLTCGENLWERIVSLKVGGFSLLTALTPSLFIEERKVNSRLSTGYPGCLFLQFCIGFWNQNLDNFPSLYQGTCWRQLFNIWSVIRFAQSQKIGMPDNLKVLGTKKSKQNKQKTKQNPNTKEHKLYL